MVAISTHVLDTSQGRPAAAVSVKLFSEKDPENWELVASGSTNADGRFSSGDFTPSPSGIFKYRFEVEEHFRRSNVASFYPFVEIVFRVDPAETKYHVPLLLNPFGYSTYRGS